MSSAGTRPLRKDAERNLRRILDAAKEVFATRGLAVTMDDVAHHAGVGVGTVYRRFANKDELIEALFVEQIEALAALAREGLAHDDPWEGFVLFMEGALDRQARDRALKELLFETGHGQERVAQRARDGSRRSSPSWSSGPAPPASCGPASRGRTRR